MTELLVVSYKIWDGALADRRWLQVLAYLGEQRAAAEASGRSTVFCLQECAGRDWMPGGRLLQVFERAREVTGWVAVYGGSPMHTVVLTAGPGARPLTSVDRRPAWDDRWIGQHGWASAALRVRIPELDRPVAILSVHGHARDPEARIHQARSIIRFAEDSEVLAVGDYNSMAANDRRRTWNASHPLSEPTTCCSTCPDGLFSTTTAARNRTADRLGCCMPRAWSTSPNTTPAAIPSSATLSSRRVPPSLTPATRRAALTAATPARQSPPASPTWPCPPSSPNARTATAVP